MKSRKGFLIMKLQTRSVLSATLLSGVLILALGGCGTGGEAARREPTPEEKVFDMLDDYGSWMEMPSYGAVWRPNVAPEWRPYTYGHWAWSDEGWVWIGYEPFAWVVYHYGSWYDDPRLGWLWVPAYDWSAARVNWAYSDNCVAWSPIAPSGAPEYLPGDPFWAQTWVVVPIDNFAHENVGVYNISKDPVRGSIRGSTPGPPQPKEIQARGRVPVQTLRVDEEKVPRGGRDLVRLRLPAEQEQQIKAHADEVDRELLVKDPGGRTRELNPSGGNAVVPATTPAKKADEAVPAVQPVRKDPQNTSDGVGKAAKPARPSGAVDRPKTEAPKPAPPPPVKKHAVAKQDEPEQKVEPKPKNPEPVKDAPKKTPD